MRGHDTFSTSVYIAMASFGTFLVVLVVLLLYLLCRKKRVPLAKLDKHKPLPPPTPTSLKLCARPIPFGDIDAATDGFNPRRILGKGRLGTVYHTISSEGDVIAIKRIYPHLVLAHASGSRFSTKIRSLSLLQHPNIVEIVGYSEAPGERIIVSEFAGMNSLTSYLHPGAEALTWEHRLHIAAGAARGVEYLHEGTAPYVVHGSIKSSNVLVDGDFCARVCDYGLSFLAPRQHHGECCSKASDVYGFGVVLLEILSGRRCEDGVGVVVEWALPLIRASRVVEVLDPRVGKPSDVKPLIRLAKVASACVGNSSNCRPSIAQVATILNNVEMQHLSMVSAV